MKTTLYYENRIKLLNARQTDNGRIVRKLERKLRKLQGDKNE